MLLIGLFFISSFHLYHYQRNISNTISRKSTQTSFHKRPLPDSLIALSSNDGKKLFREALDLGHMESYFPLSEQFITQSEPSFCSISSLAMVLNALKYDPQKIWKGAWRWVTEETLQCESAKVCGHSLEQIKEIGMNFSEFKSLGRCHGINIESYQISDYNLSNIQSFRKLISNSTALSDENVFIIVNFSRKHLGQTGDGHFSPIGGYHKEKDLVLIMDVARFKYPPFWVPLIVLWESMSKIDFKTGESRGYFVLSTTKCEQNDILIDKHIIETNLKKDHESCNHHEYQQS